MIDTMNKPEILLQHSGVALCASLVVNQGYDQPPRFVKRSVTPNRREGMPSSAKKFHSADDDILDFSMNDLSAASSRSYSGSVSMFDLSQDSCCQEQVYTEDTPEQIAAATKIQAILRGTLARWNLPILKLQHKLASIQAVKDKQLKKIQQRKVQTMKSLKAEQEHQQEHRIVRRRLRRVKFLRNKYAKEKIMALEENQHLRNQCQQLAQHNDNCAAMLSQYIGNIEIAQRDLSILKMSRQRLQETCHAYQTILEVFRGFVDAEALETEESS